MSLLKVTFNNVDITEYIDVLQGFTPFIGANWTPSIDTVEGVISGDRFGYQRYSAKEIPMPFRIKGNLKDKYDLLQKALSVSEPKKLIFSNMTDRYYLAIPSGTLDFEQMCRTGSGTITWIIPNGLSYAVNSKGFIAAKSGGILQCSINNTGNVPVAVDYEITHSAQNGYIGIVSSEGAMQFGYEDETDGGNVTNSQTLMNSTNMFNQRNDSSGTACKIKSDFAVNGLLQAATFAGAQYGKVLKVQSVGSGSGWHGGQRTYTLSSGSTHFTSYLRQCFIAGALGQLGYQAVSYMTSDGELICGIELIKKGSGSDTLYYRFYSNGKKLKEFEVSSTTKFKPGYANRVTRYNEKLIFHFDGTYYTFEVPEIKDKQVSKVQVTIGGFGSYAAVADNYISVIEFVKFSSEWKDNPNRYSAGDVVRIDGSKGTISVNDMVRMGDEVTGTSYFKAPPGITKVEFYKSDWASDITAKAIIREAWL